MMTIEERKLWIEGKGLWQEYVNVNGYSFSFTEDGLNKLSRILDLNKSHLRKRINVYLEN
jgi:hypothetical protein